MTPTNSLDELVEKLRRVSDAICDSIAEQRQPTVGLEDANCIDRATEAISSLLKRVREQQELLEIIAGGCPDVSDTAIVVGDGASALMRQVNATPNSDAPLSIGEEQ